MPSSASVCDIAHLSVTCCDHLTESMLICAASTLLLPIATAKYSWILQTKRKKRSMKTIYCVSTIWCSVRGRKETSLQGHLPAANISIKSGATERLFLQISWWKSRRSSEQPSLKCTFHDECVLGVESPSGSTVLKLSINNKLFILC